MRKIDSRKAFAIAVFGGLLIGKLIKKFAFGMLIGVLLSLLYVLLRTAPKKKGTPLAPAQQSVWGVSYAGVIVFLLGLLFFFYHFTRYFA